MAVFAFSVAPMTAGESVAEQVAEAVRIVRESGLPNRTTSMFTEIEGEWDEVMPVVRRATEAVAPRAAPDETPIRPGSARGLRNMPCRAAPATARALPTSTASTTRGSRMAQTIASCCDV